MKEQLRECPFCYSKAILRQYDKKYWIVSCSGLDCHAYEYPKKYSVDRTYFDKEEAIRVWNTRPIPKTELEPLDAKLVTQHIEYWWGNPKFNIKEYLRRFGSGTGKQGLDIQCDFCPNKLNELGGLLFSPPINGKCEKKHICVDCYSKLSPARSEVDERKFPIQIHGVHKNRPVDTHAYIPWFVLAPHNEQAKINHGDHQPLERLAKRGGLSPREAICIIKDERFTAGKSELEDLAELTDIVAKAISAFLRGSV